MLSPHPHLKSVGSMGIRLELSNLLELLLVLDFQILAVLARHRLVPVFHKAILPGHLHWGPCHLATTQADAA